MTFRIITALLAGLCAAGVVNGLIETPRMCAAVCAGLWVFSELGERGEK